MRPVVIDFETYFADDYSLSKGHTTESYVRDIKFEAHGAAIKWQPNIPARWYDERELRTVLKNEDWSDVFLITHHAHFDGFILSHHYNVSPCMYGCTLSMARLLLGNHLSVSLDAVRTHFGLPRKRTPYHLFKNKTWEQLTPAVRQELGDGACDEVESIWALFCKHLAPHFPGEEWDVVDSIVRMFVQPVLKGDTSVLAEVWRAEESKKRTLLTDLGFDLSTNQGRAHAESQLQSAERFADLLRAEGVEPETKVSAKGNTNYAFAKTDPFMRDVLPEHESERVRALAQARLGVKSTILQTRAETYGFMAQRGPLPVYLRYAGAGTLRPSGGDGGNWLNLKRGSALRRSICAPDGFWIAPVDASQIECRVLHYLAGGADEPVIQKFRAHEDPYVDLATQFYREPIYKPEKNDPRKAEMEAKRGMGKQGRLMCLASDTEVLTNNGVKSIVDVTLLDKLWDGIEWVSHQGLIYQGEQNVVEIKGVKMTSDHLILCDQRRWLPAAFLLNENILSRGLAVGLASLPFRVSKLVRKAGYLKWFAAVRAERRNIPSILRIFMLDVQHAAARARARLQDFGVKNILVTPMFVQAIPIVFGCSEELPPFIRDVVPIAKMNGMAVEAFKFGTDGAVRMAGENFWLTWSLCQDGINPNWKLIVRTIKKAIGQATSNLPRANNKCEIDAVSNSSNKKLPTYDLSFAGPRNRFTILSDAGPLIVHNCGYGAAGKQFKATAKNGLYGPAVDIAIDDADSFVQLYRQTNPSICARPTGYWAQCEQMLRILAGGATQEIGPLLLHNHKILVGPGRIPMNYDSLEWFKPPQDQLEDYREWEWNGFWRLKTRQGWKTMWGSKLTQNICEGVSRVIVSQAMTRIKRQYGIRSLNWPYDELLLLIPKGNGAENTLELCLAEMQRTPDWLPGLPLDAETSGLSDRYEK